MVGASRLPGYGAVATSMTADAYVRDVVADHRADPVLSAHLKDGWSVVRPIHGYLQHDAESANWPHSLPLGRMFHTLFSAE